jgi:hypothetical protein
MKANAIAFETPIPKVYQQLPPPSADMDDVLAFFFTGPCKPTEQDYKRSLVLVRRNQVVKALEWLNHSDYADIEISHKTLQNIQKIVHPVQLNTNLCLVI